MYGTGRSWPAGEAEASFRPVPLDVRDDASVKAAVKALLEAEGRIDVLVNNAGISQSGSVEETPVDVARQVLETNYLGPVRLIQAVLPAMRQQGRGTIVNVGSAAGKIGIPFQGHYAASKFAVEGLSEALQHELRSQGIRVLLIEPGDVRTDIWENTPHLVPADSPYASALKRFHAAKAKEMGDAAEAPESVAARVADLVEGPTRHLRHPVAKGAGFFLLARKLLPDRVFLWAVRKNYGLSA